MTYKNLMILTSIKENHVKENPNAEQYILDLPKVLFDDREFVLQLVSIDGHYLKFASNNLKNNKSVVTMAVTKSGGALEYASDRLKDCEEIVLLALLQDGFLLYHASKRIQDNYNWVMAAVKTNSWAIDFASDRLKDNKAIAIESVSKYGSCLKSVSDRLRDDEEVVLVAVLNDGEALEYASDRLKNDRYVVRIAAEQTPKAIKYASKKIKQDKKFIHNIMQTSLNNYELSFLDKIKLYTYGHAGNGTWEYKQALKACEKAKLNSMNNAGFLFRLLMLDADYLQFVCDEAMLKLKNKDFYWVHHGLENNKKLMLKLVSLNGGNLKYANNRLKNDKEVALAALRNSCLSTTYVGKRLYKDRDVVLALADNFFEPDEYFDFVFDLNSLNEKFKDNKEIVMHIVSRCERYGGTQLQYASERLRNDKDVVLAAARSYKPSFKFASDELKNDIEFALEIENLPDRG